MDFKPFGFSTEKRLRSKANFQYVFKNARRLNSTMIRVLYCHHDNTKYARLGVIIRKKDVAHAVERNRIRRIVRDVFRQQKLFGLDIVIFAKSNAQTVSNQALAKCVAHQLKKCKALC